MNIKLQTVQPEFLAKLLQDVDTFKVDADNFVDDYTNSSVSRNLLFTIHVA